MPPLVVGFDLDMTLIDPRPGVVATFDALNAELGTTIDGAAIAARLGPPLESEMAAYFPPTTIDAVCDRYRARSTRSSAHPESSIAARAPATRLRRGA